MRKAWKFLEDKVSGVVGIRMIAPVAGYGPCRRKHLWSRDFMAERLSDGRAPRFLTVIHEFSRKCLAIGVGHKLNSDDGLDMHFGIFVSERMLEYIRSYNDLDFTAKKIEGMAGRPAYRKGVYRAGKPVGERLYRDFQWSYARQIPE